MMAEGSTFWAVLNPGGRDPSQTCPDGKIPAPGEGHPPVNYHAYAFCTGGGFYRDWREIPDACGAVLILLRRNAGAARAAMQALRGRGHRCWLAVKEAGYYQVLKQLGRTGTQEAWKELAREAEGVIAPTEHLVPLWRALGARRVEFVPTPYPVEIEEWNFGKNASEASGIFIGTREFGIASRRHLQALRMAVEIGRAQGRPVRLLDDGSCPSRLRRELNVGDSGIEWIPAPLSYPDYLRLLARHEVVFQLDRGGVPGQVAGDCALARTLLVGGNGTNEQILFPETHGAARDDAELAALLGRALADPDWRRGLVQQMEREARSELSYESGARRLRGILNSAV